MSDIHPTVLEMGRYPAFSKSVWVCPPQFLGRSVGFWTEYIGLGRSVRLFQSTNQI